MILNYTSIATYEINIIKSDSLAHTDNMEKQSADSLCN